MKRRRRSVLWLLLPVIAAGLTLSYVRQAHPVAVPPKHPGFHMHQMHGFLMEHGAYKTLDAPWGVDTQARKINDHGQITGTYIDTSFRKHGFLLVRGVYAATALSGIIASNLQRPHPTWALSANDRGESVGFFLDRKNHRHGFLLRHGIFTPLDMPHAINTELVCVNNLGEIIGVYNGQHGFVLKNGVYTTLDVPGSLTTWVVGINDKEQIIGWYIDRHNTQHAFLLSRGVYTNLYVPGTSELVYPESINNKGQIVGWYQTISAPALGI